jgi:hypothetical protein
MNKFIVVLVSGGRSSAMMARHIQTDRNMKSMKSFMSFAIQVKRDLKQSSF